MTIIETLIQLRNDIKDWVTNNLVALNEKIDNKSEFSGDYNDLTNKPNVLDDSSDSLNVVDLNNNVILRVDKDGLTTTNVNANNVVVDGHNVSDAIDEIENLNNLVGDTSVSSQIEEAINSKTYFSGDYNDLTNKPDILEDGSDSFVIADSQGNVILDVDEDGLKTTAISANTISVNGEDVAAKIKSVNDSLDGHIDDEVAHITATERAAWDAKSEFSGDYNDLINKPNLTDDGSGALNIADEAGNIIMTVNENGLNTTALSVNGVNIQSTFDSKIDKVYGKGLSTEDYTTAEKEKLAGLDSELAKKSDIDHTHDDIYYTETEIDNKLSSKSDVGHTHDDMYYTEAEIDEKLFPVTAHIDNTDIHVTADDKTRWDNITNITDDNSGNLSIADEAGNVVAKIDENGLETTTVTAKSVVVNGTDLKTAIDGNTNNITNITTKIDNHIADKVVHITADERSTWNAKASTVYVDEKVAGLVDSSPETLDTLNELAAALGDDPNFATTVAEQIGLKADKNYVDEQLDKKSDTGHTHDDRYYTEEEINTKLSGKSDVGHTHDDVYYTESEIDTKLSGKSDKTHSHDDRYYTEAEIDEKMSPVDNHISDVNIHVTSEDKTKWNNINNILDDGTGEFNIADPDGNVVFKVNEDGAQVTNMIVDGIDVSAKFDLIDAHTHNYAGSSTPGGAATSAEKLNTDAGSTTQPVFFRDGIPVAIPCTIEKSVPSDAKFTDTVYEHPAYTAKTGVPDENQTPAFGSTFNISQPVSDETGHIIEMNTRVVTIPNDEATASSPGLMSAADKDKLDGIENGATKIIVDKEMSDDSENPVQNKIVNAALADKSDVGHTHNYAGSATSGGSAISAEKLDTSAGSVTQPIYFNEGKPEPTTYQLYKTVPEDAIFTDTVYDDTDVRGIIDKKYTKPENGISKNDLDSGVKASLEKADSAIQSLSGYATEGYVDNAVDTKLAGLVNSAPETLNTLDELAAALGDDPNFATTVATQIGLKADKTYVDDHITDSNIHVTTEDKTKWDNVTNILDDETGEFNIADPSGNVIFKVNEDGAQVTNMIVDGIDVSAKFDLIDAHTHENYLEADDISYPVISVNDKTGDVILSASDVGALSSNDVVNNLSSTDATVPLSAAQGKTLQDQIDDINDSMLSKVELTQVEYDSLTEKDPNVIYVITDEDDANYIAEDQKGVANGVAALDENGKVPTSQLPDSMMASTHASTHKTGGTDPITPADIGAFPIIDAREGYNMDDVLKGGAHFGIYRVGSNTEGTPAKYDKSDFNWGLILSTASGTTYGTQIAFLSGASFPFFRNLKDSTISEWMGFYGDFNTPYYVGSSAPSNTKKLWINTSNNTLNYYTGSAWKTLGAVFG